MPDVATTKTGRRSRVQIARDERAIEQIADMLSAPVYLTASASELRELLYKLVDAVAATGRL